MIWERKGIDAARRARWSAAAIGLLLCGWSLLALLIAPAPTRAAGAHGARHFACSGPNSARVPCHFSTPSGNIRCLWTPHPNSVACELLASGRAYRLHPSGRARSIRLSLARRGDTLPTDQQLVFPQSLACRDTRTSMTCTQDFGLGEFKLSPAGSHSS